MHSEKEELAFRLFCLFNRFCNTDEIPMILGAQAQFLLYSWLNISEPPREFKATFVNVLDNILTRRDNYVVVLAKKYYDQLVRDILIENRLAFRIKRVVPKNGNNIYKRGKL